MRHALFWDVMKFLNCLILEDGEDRLCRNVGNKRQFSAASKRSFGKLRSFWTDWHLEMEQIGCSETSATTILRCVNSQWSPAIINRLYSDHQRFCTNTSDHQHSWSPALLITRVSDHQHFWLPTLLITSTSHHQRFWSPALLIKSTSHHQRFRSPTLLITSASDHQQFWLPALLITSTSDHQRFWSPALLITSASDHHYFPMTNTNCLVLILMIQIKKNTFGLASGWFLTLPNSY